MARIKFQTTLDEDIIKLLKVTAIERNCDVNDILEELVRENMVPMNSKAKGAD